MILASAELTAAQSISMLPSVIVDSSKLAWLAITWLCCLLAFFFFTLPATSLHGNHYFTNDNAMQNGSQL